MAKARAANAFNKMVGSGHASEFAERMILQGLQSEQIRWRCRHWKGPQNLNGRPEFWRDERLNREASLVQQLRYVAIDWSKDFADRVDPDCAAYGIKVASDGLAKLLPAADVGGDDTYDRVAVEVRRMKEAGELDPSMRITAFARKIESGIGRIVGWQYIKNSLPGWGFWPISSIK